MLISSIKLSGFRNFASAKLDFSAPFVVFYGDNGSGKTSLLESLYFLAHAKSFRASSANVLIQKGADSFVLFSELSDGEKHYNLGIERGIEIRQKIRFAGETLRGISGVASLLPMQFLDTDSHRHFSSGSQSRRKLLDWGVFHVEHSFANHWKNYEKALKQRNYLLKSGDYNCEIKTWENIMVQNGEVISGQREQYFANLKKVLCDIWPSLMSSVLMPEINFYRGYDGCSLQQALTESRAKDVRYGYSTVGPHRADLRITVGDHSGYDILSQGQQKAMMFALKVSQGICLKELMGKSTIYLIDDLPAELDNFRLADVISVLSEHASQVFITSILKNNVIQEAAFSDVDYFKVENGVIV